MEGIAKGAEELMPRAAPCRIDGGTDENHWPDPLRPGRGELCHDLTPHRVCDEGRADEAVRLHPSAERRGKPADADPPGQRRAPPLAGQIRCDRREG